MRRLNSPLLLALLMLAGCPDDGGPADYGDPTSLATPTEVDGIVAWVAAPDLNSALDSAAPEVVIGAYVPGEDTVLETQVSRLERDADGNDQSLERRPAAREGEGEDQRFRVEVGLVHGTNRFLAFIASPDGSRSRRLAFSLAYEGQEPGISVRVLAAEEGGDACDVGEAIRLGLTRASTVCVTGNVSAPAGGPANVALTIDEDGDSATVEADDDGAFALPLELRSDRTETIAATATDAAGGTTTVRVQVVQDSTPPALALTTTARQTSAPSLLLEGTVSDDSGVEAVELEIDGQTQLRAATVDEWQLDVPLSPGEWEFTLLARDLAGNETRLPLLLSRQRILWLGPPPEDEVSATQLEIDRGQIDSLLTEQSQRDLELVKLDVEPTVREALARIRDPEQFGVDTSEWGDPERNLQRILAMTSDNADLSGTTLEELLRISDALGLPSPRVLSELLDLGLTEPIIDLDSMAAVVMDRLVATHPNITQDGDTYAIEVSLYDVQQDLTTLAPRFGATGGHPGFLSGESFSAVLEPGFQLTLPVNSNLVQYDAVDLSRETKDFHFLIDGDQVLDFNVLTDEFNVVGLADEPAVDLRFAIQEHPGPGMLGAGTNRTAQPDPNDPGFFFGDGEGWSVDPWLFEPMAADAAYRLFHRRYEADSFQRTLRYDTGSITDAAVIEWDRGWVTINTAGGIGNPPAPVYVWDFIMEVAQVRLHDGGIAEGAANMGFTLEDVPVGLTADELIEKLRPSLNEQEEELSDQLVGELGLATPRAELFYMPADGREGALAFRAEEDSAAEYPYASPGFFSDEELTMKVSTTDAVGGVDETAHEKVPAAVGATYYAADEDGVVYSIEVVERDGDRVGLLVAKAGGAQ